MVLLSQATEVNLTKLESKKPIVALYHRVSTRRQDERGALEQLRAEAHRRGYKIGPVVTETVSGANDNRPGLAKVLEEVRRRRCDVVMVWKLDRFGRSTVDLLRNLEALRTAGVSFVVTTQSIEIHSRKDPMSNLLFTLLAAVAEFESTLISERTRAGMDRARRRGARIGRPPTVDPSAVKMFRDEGLNWKEIGAQLGVPPSTARSALGRGQ